MSPSSFLSFNLLTSFFSLHFLPPSSFLPIFSLSVTQFTPYTHSSTSHHLLPKSTLFTRHLHSLPTTHSLPKTIPILTLKHFLHSLSTMQSSHPLHRSLQPLPTTSHSTFPHQPLTPTHSPPLRPTGGVDSGGPDLPQTAPGNP
ncbi:hypothetical protein Pmani_015076 [Petrolisthes manimaculis]|uniref:Uncharacterized protein n=1 Tax=Petrolisthes manimaculis TaxID=1843537 RepID=A0AAE1PV65_9EUCA|nr:hypothetical protein Pmani_015076 [Petrolisthes manimaculis]